MSRLVRDILFDARNLIAKGWCKRVSVRRTPKGVCYCASGAVTKAAEMNGCDGAVDPWRLKALATLKEAMPPCLSPTWSSSVEAWNDAPGREHAEVLVAFDRAIEATSC